MSEKTVYPSVRVLETSFLRKGWWLFPLLGAMASLALGDPFWQWVAGSSPFSAGWYGFSIFRTGGGAAAGLSIPLIWWLGLRAKRRLILVPLLVFCLVLLVECGLRMPTIQSPLWLASRARLESDQSYMREVCYIRLEEVVGRTTTSPAVLLMGSSQVLNGVDVQLLRELLQPMPVIRRAMFGMSPLKMLSMLAYVPFHRGDICVQYLSEFDFTNQKEFPFDWFRPYASWETLPDVLACIPRSVQLRHWRQEVDYLLAATFESWRDRDFLRQIAFHGVGRSTSSGTENLPPDPAGLVTHAQGALFFSVAEQNAFQLFLQQLVEQDVRLLIFEGDVNPAILSRDRLQAKQIVRGELQDIARKDGYTYISIQEQGLGLSAEHWLDMTHLNEIGRDRLTRRIARELMPQ